MSGIIAGGILAIIVLFLLVIAAIGVFVFIVLPALGLVMVGFAVVPMLGGLVHRNRKH